MFKVMRDIKLKDKIDSEFCGSELEALSGKKQLSGTNSVTHREWALTNGNTQILESNK